VDKVAPGRGVVRGSQVVVGRSIARRGGCWVARVTTASYSPLVFAFVVLSFTVSLPLAFPLSKFAFALAFVTMTVVVVAAVLVGVAARRQVLVPVAFVFA